MSRGPLEYRLVARDGPARAGVMTLGGVEIETPVFMPVGTKACVRMLDCADVEALGYRLILGNTYHLMLRPGGEFLEDWGGLHRFWSWEGKILTDSGGFQAWSLAHKTRKDDDGVVFRSHLDGSLETLTPERSAELQCQFGSDIVMAFDECLPYPLTHARAEALTERSLAWTRRSHARYLERRKEHQCFFGILQGGEFEELRTRSGEGMLELDCDGYAIGGLAIGEPSEVMREQIGVADRLLPADRPRYLMGVGTPRDLLDAIGRGVDMFDCVVPTRDARHAHAYTAGHARLNLKNARFRTDDNPVEEGCPCSACVRYSRAYLHHLIKGKEETGKRLLTIHNLMHYRRLMERARQAILEGRFAAFASQEEVAA